MTLYSIFVSNERMEVLDQREILETTVGEMRKRYILTEGAPEPFWYSYDDQTVLVSVPNEENMRKLHIFSWGNPPYDLAFFNKKPHVYGVEGIWNNQFLEDLFYYIKQHVTLITK